MSKNNKKLHKIDTIPLGGALRRFSHKNLADASHQFWGSVYQYILRYNYIYFESAGSCSTRSVSFTVKSTRKKSEGPREARKSRNLKSRAAPHQGQLHTLGCYHTTFFRAPLNGSDTLLVW